jgi:hypothetical protein
MIAGTGWSAIHDVRHWANANPPVLRSAILEIIDLSDRERAGRQGDDNNAKH